MLEVLNVIKQTPAMVARNPKPFETLKKLWDLLVLVKSHQSRASFC
jgi:hypothetical protein